VHGSTGTELAVRAGSGNSSFDFSPRAIADRKRLIATQLAPFDAVQLIGSMVVFSSFASPESYSEPQTPPSSRLEYVISTLLEREDPAGRRVLTAAQTARAAGAIQQAFDAADEIGLQTTFAIKSKAEAGAHPLDRVGGQLQLIDSTIRGPGYEHQARHLIGRSLGGTRLAARLTSLLGFDAADALALEAAVSHLIQERFNREMEQIVRLARGSEEIAYQLQRRGEFIVGVTASELAGEAVVSVDVAQAFLDHFSVGFGEAGGLHLLSGQAPIRERPFVKVGDGRFLWTSSMNLLWAIQPAFEEALRTSPDWERYQTGRAAAVEEMTVEPLAAALRVNSVWSNLRFSVANEPTYEIDGLVLVDDLAFVLEVKSGRFSAKAKRGRKRELRPALEQLIGRASSQARRLASAIESSDEIAFAGTDGSPVDIDLASIRRVEPVIVTLEDLSWLAGYSQELIDVGILEREAVMPWVVTAYDLELIAAMLEFPAQLTLYLAARRELNTPIASGDEMNLWMAHWFRKLELPDDVRAMFRGDWTEDIDRYFMFQQGELPEMPLQRRVRRDVTSLDHARQPGYLAATEDIIRGDQAQRPLLPTIVARSGSQTLHVYGRS
jgi:hypothetical protein